MERRGQVDAPGVASNLTRLSSSAILTFFLLISAASGSAQDNFADVQLAEKARQLFTEQRWQEVVALVESARSPSADLDFYYGSALAQLGRLADARQAFAAGSRLQPHDKRFPLELAGVAFKQKDYPRAARYLRRALHLDPHDAYGNDFLGTVYFLQGNIEAALKYWNRVNKPAVAEVRTVPTPRVSASLLDRAFTFAPASSLQLADLLTSDVRTRGLGIFPSQQFDLQARDDGKFDVLFRNRERDGWGQTKLEKLFLLFRGLPFLSITPEYYNLRRQAVNLTSMYRWDAEKRRLSAELSGPFRGNPKFRYGLLADLRSENWDIRNSFQGTGSAAGKFEYAARSRGRKLFVFRERTMALVCGG